MRSFSLNVFCKYSVLLLAVKKSYIYFDFYADNVIFLSLSKDLNVLLNVITFIQRQLRFVLKVKPMNTNRQDIPISIFSSFHFLIRFPEISAICLHPPRPAG